MPRFVHFTLDPLKRFEGIVYLLSLEALGCSPDNLLRATDDTENDKRERGDTDRQTERQTDRQTV